MLGDFSGGTAPAGSTAPHPEFPSNLSVVSQLNSITLGGFGGLNN
jgi:hypothetical protein